MDVEEHTITFTLNEDDFEASMRRQPKSQAEFDDWASLLEKGLRNGHIDWGMLYGCTRDAMS